MIPSSQDIIQRLSDVLKFGIGMRNANDQKGDLDQKQQQTLSEIKALCEETHKLLSQFECSYENHDRYVNQSGENRTLVRSKLNRLMAALGELYEKISTLETTEHSEYWLKSIRAASFAIGKYHGFMRACCWPNNDYRPKFALEMAEGHELPITPAGHEVQKWFMHGIKSGNKEGNRTFRPKVKAALLIILLGVIETAIWGSQFAPVLTPTILFPQALVPMLGLAVSIFATILFICYCVRQPNPYKKAGAAPEALDGIDNPYAENEEQKPPADDNNQQTQVARHRRFSDLSMFSRLPDLPKHSRRDDPCDCPFPEGGHEGEPLPASPAGRR